MLVEDQPVPVQQILVPRIIKPENFNYDYKPNFANQNIWTITDNLFIANEQYDQFITEKNPKQHPELVRNSKNSILPIKMPFKPKNITELSEEYSGLHNSPVQEIRSHRQEFREKTEEDICGSERTGKNLRCEEKLKKGEIQNEMLKSSQKSCPSEQSAKKSNASSIMRLHPLPKARKSHIRTDGVSKKSTKIRAYVRKSTDSEELMSSSSKGSNKCIVRTIKTKIIPKVTVNNQLLKSAPTAQSKEINNVKAMAKETTPAAKKEIQFWTPEKLALLDKITADRRLKAVLVSAGESFYSTKKHVTYKITPTPRTKARQETVLESEITNKTSSTSSKKTTTKPIMRRSPNAIITEKKFSNVIPEIIPESAWETDVHNAIGAGKPLVQHKFKNTNDKSEQKTTLTKLKIKPNPKIGQNLAHASSAKKIPDKIIQKKRPKFGTATNKAKERLAQITEEQKVAHIRRTNLEHLKKILEKSINKESKLDVKLKI